MPLLLLGLLSSLFIYIVICILSLNRILILNLNRPLPPFPLPLSIEKEPNMCLRLQHTIPCSCSAGRSSELRTPGVRAVSCALADLHPLLSVER